MARAAAAPETGVALTASGARACWLVLHELHDTSAPALIEALAAARPGQAVHGLSSAALLTWVRWQSRLDATGASCRLQWPGVSGLDLHAGPSPRQGPGATALPGLTLAGVVNRLHPLTLPTTADDAEYKSAEWQALCNAWLHGLPCPVLNRPRCADVMAATRTAVRWRQRAAQAGLPIWPLTPVATGHGVAHTLQHRGMGSDGAPQSAGLLVVGEQTLPALDRSGPHWPLDLQQAAARAVREAGLDLLAWTGGTDARGVWRVSGATPWPVLRAFGPAALDAISGWLDPTPDPAPLAKSRRAAGKAAA